MMLLIKSLTELKIEPFNWEGQERIDLAVFQPFEHRKLFKYKSIKFMLTITDLPDLALYPSLFQENSKDWWEGRPACVKKSIYSFLDQQDNKRKEIEYWLIQIWQGFDPSNKRCYFLA